MTFPPLFLGRCMHCLDNVSLDCTEECIERFGFGGRHGVSEENCLLKKAQAAFRREIATCMGCGVREHIHLLDGKPPPGTPPEDHENADFTHIVCVACYGPGWCPTGGVEDISLSIAPQLAPLYAEWKAKQNDDNDE